MKANWSLYTTLIGFFSVGLLIWVAEKRGGFTPRQVSLIAVLTTLCAAGRAVTGTGLLFLQPTMFLVEITGFVYGACVGFFVGAMTPLISNFFMGQGPWTPWQMLCWGMVGVSGAVLKALFPTAGNKTLTVICFLWGYLYGAFMDIWQWSVFMRPLTIKTYFLVWVAGFSFDSLRAIGNLLCCAILGHQTLKILEYFRKKIDVQYLEEL
ncbi:energy-coupling factor transport system substrate-specific component [Thermanaeromonas toyohensis ToBE]|uniref:Energy-coupling factor transport system substrate-specific component n=1 Tax=Thermanaeromonas toyohensis ToBE TaxID=698762 RepID=A0A1W1VIP4_9FIRM|nr:ECF transporter S component [Thermanaeromonas toyohensis]SMB93232.1 energy-coupling factor transport system substrate-specific component [Thermanaeromonas toyohensis ToBE]